MLFLCLSFLPVCTILITVTIILITVTPIPIKLTISSKLKHMYLSSHFPYSYHLQIQEVLRTSHSGKRRTATRFGNTLRIYYSIFRQKSIGIITDKCLENVHHEHITDICPFIFLRKSSVRIPICAKCKTFSCEKTGHKGIFTYSGSVYTEKMLFCSVAKKGTCTT